MKLCHPKGKHGGVRPQRTFLKARRRRGFTLLELTVNLVVVGILMGGMGSAMMLASRALPNGQGPLEKKRLATDVVDQMAGELFYATSITEATQTAVTFTVADRGHGSSGPETIRYEWSGTPGDPLTRRYNGGTVAKVCEDVQLLDLVYTTGTTPLHGAPKVLLVVDDDTSPDVQNLAKQALIESFDFSVQIVAANRSAAEFSPLIASHDVMYISAQFQMADILDKSLDLSMGIVTEMRLLYDDLGFSAGRDFRVSDAISFIDNTHEITSPFAIGTLTICDSPQELSLIPNKDHAPGLQVLAAWRAWPELAVLDVGAEQYGGGTARGRRVKLPWGGAINFDINSLNTDGETIMRRAIAWAAAPVVYTSARIVLQPTKDSASLVETQTQILNAPEANGS